MSKQVSIGDLVVQLSLIEAHARAARELLCHALVYDTTPDGLVLSGQQAPAMPNKEIARQMMAQHHAAMNKLQGSAMGLFQPEQAEPTEPVPNRMRLHLNGDGKA